MQRPFDRHRLHADTELPQVVRQLLDADAVGAPAEADVGRATGAQHVSAVEGAGCLDVGDPQAEVAHGPLDPGGLAAPLRRTGARDHRQVGVHDDRVLDEHRVGVLVGGLDLHDPPPVAAQRVGVRLPLLAGEVEVERASVDVGDEAVGQPRARPADECDRDVHGHSEW